MTDRIVYVVWTQGGGIDGRDSEDKPRRIAAFFDRETADKVCGAWSEIKLEIVENVEDRIARILEKLDPVEKLLLTSHGVLNEQASILRKPA